MSKQTGEDGWRPLIDLLSGTKNSDDMEALLQLFLTPEEQDFLAARYLIVLNLLQGEKTQRELAQELHVSISQITRGSNMLKRIDEKTRKYLIKQST